MDRRSSQRVQILGDFRVYDHLAEQYLGVIVDASLGGFLLRGPTAFEENKRYHLGILLQEKFLDRKAINFTAVCKWSITKRQGKQALAGFMIVNIDETEALLWQNIIENYAFNAYEID